jgi:hypothetical protein
VYIDARTHLYEHTLFHREKLREIEVTYVEIDKVIVLFVIHELIVE